LRFDRFFLLPPTLGGGGAGAGGSGTANGFVGKLLGGLGIEAFSSAIRAGGTRPEPAAGLVILPYKSLVPALIDLPTSFIFDEVVVIPSDTACGNLLIVLEYVA